jgi:hypothetical protein
MVVDNTQYPYPGGAFSSSDISLHETTAINITLSDTSQIVGVRCNYVTIRSDLHQLYGICDLWGGYCHTLLQTSQKSQGY